MNYTILGLVAYLILTLGIAWFYGRAKKNEDYLIAGRDLGMWTSVMTIVSSKIGAGFIISIMAFLYQWGAIAMYAFVGILIGYFLFIPFARYLKKMGDEHKLYTMPEFYRHSFGFKAGLVVAILMFANMEISVITQLIGGAHILADTTSVTYNWGVLIIASLVLFYLVLGGFRSVVATDFLQGLALLGLVPIFLVVTMFAIGDFSVIDWTISDDGYKNIPNFIIAGIVFPFGTPELWQRVYAIKDDKTVKKTLITTGILYTLFGFLLCLVGLYFKAVVGDILPENLLISGFEQVLPAGLAIFGMVFMMSAVMSSFDTYVFTASTILVQDLINPKGKEHSGAIAVWQLRLWQVVLVVAGVGIAIRIPNIIDTTVLYVGISIIVGIVGISAAIRKQKLTDPFLPLFLGSVGVIYFVFTEGITPNIALAAAAGTLGGLLINAIYSYAAKRLSR